MESSFVADGGGALLALGCANPVAGFVGGITVALLNVFVSLVRDAEIGGVQSRYTSSAEKETQKAFEAAQMEAMVALQSSRFH
ncbi:hypothetical protein NESM_000932600 [Novymonas esmeraldas]|uniref:Uncharacterized protein n=1 Tax=Novymonas esmeraldas TaxID=1808958 RepID=A0AAW0F113_9TRYP